MRLFCLLLADYNMRNALLHLFSLFFPLLIHAQTPHPWEIGGGIGFGDYLGDLQAIRGNLQNLDQNPSLSVHFRHNLTSVFAGPVIRGRRGS